MRVLPLALVLAFAASALAEDVEEVITEDSVKELLVEVSALVAKETGAKFDPMPKGKIGTTKEVVAILVDELRPQIPLIQPGIGEDQVDAVAKATAEACGTALLGKYAPATNTFYVLRENFPKLAKSYGRPGLVSRESLRVVMIHELAHAADQAKYKAFDHIRDIKTGEELQAWNAVLEGHAQYVTQRVLAKEEGGEKCFHDFEGIVATVPPGTEAGLKQVLEIFNAAAHFAYHDGLAFFKSLEKTEKEGFVERVFASPPVRRAEILHPEQWGHPEAAPKMKDLAATWDALKEDLGEDWTPVVASIGEVELRAAAGDLIPKAQVDAILKSVRGGSALISNSKSAPGAKQLMVMVLELEDEAAAADYMKFTEALLKAKDEKFKTGTVKITEAKYGELKLKGGQKSLDARKTVEVAGQEVKVRDATFVVGRFAIEMAWTNVPVKKKEVEAQAEQLVELLGKE